MYLKLSRGCSAGLENGIRPRVNYVSKISSAFGTRYIFPYVPGTSYQFVLVALSRTVAPYVGSPGTSSDTTIAMLSHALRKLGGAGTRHRTR
jgi:hypothetical protein